MTLKVWRGFGGCNKVWFGFEARAWVCERTKGENER